MRPRLILLCILTVLLSVAFTNVISVHAQCQDAAGGSIECPEDSNPNEDGEGSPGDLAAPERIPGDFDGDGTPDETDQCVEQSGPDWNNGCPTDLSAPPVTESPDPTAPSAPQDITLPQEGPCIATPASAEKVNVRAEPDPNAAVLDTIAPGQSYEVVTSEENDTGLWHLLLNPSGWVNGSAMKVGGDCGTVFDPDGLISLDLAGEPEEDPTAAKQKKSCGTAGTVTTCVWTKGSKIISMCTSDTNEPNVYNCTHYK